MLSQSESGPGQRITLDGTTHDVAARIQTDSGPYVILNDENGNFAALCNEGQLRDREDVEYVSTTAWAKMPDSERQAQQAAVAGVPANAPTTVAPNSTDNRELLAAIAKLTDRIDNVEKNDNPPTDAPDPTDPPQTTDGIPPSLADGK